MGAKLRRRLTKLRLCPHQNVFALTKTQVKFLVHMHDRFHSVLPRPDYIVRIYVDILRGIDALVMFFIWMTSVLKTWLYFQMSPPWRPFSTKTISVLFVLEWKAKPKLIEMYTFSNGLKWIFSLANPKTWPAVCLIMCLTQLLVKVPNAFISCHFEIRLS